MAGVANVAATARVAVTVEVSVGGWGADCQLEQVFKQATEAAIGILNRRLDGTPTVRVVGVPRVEAVLVDRG